MAIIFLNGCTSAGKSSLAKALQEQIDEPYLLLGIDDAFASLPQRSHNNPEGFFFDRDDRGLVRLNFGAFGLATLKAHHRAAAAIAQSGVNLILDEVILTPELRKDWGQVLKGLDVTLVGVHCDLAELERREKERGDRVIGQARGQFDIVHKDMVYDIEVNTSQISPEETASSIIDFLAQNPSRLALSQMAKTED
ncbi:chloramphenicol phosphotransferase CPT family protein [Alterisphingorhabdus coralli]|uniref:AAA family ATPase n=1 Tax=Alterisphingorhabdus coralli TaxID=3071408 RepID=A0AA97F503_9SPHN|nr:AAA family ATPase [Parasphingorhabdus sp. SCSIO 66989]WOE74409.1 AAA family ATPase [Parasphingorhabdus sp. SCSIO 66989]